MFLALGWEIDGFSWTMTRGSRVIKEDTGGRCIFDDEEDMKDFGVSTCKKEKEEEQHCKE